MSVQNFPNVQHFHSGRVPNREHTSRPWRIHELAPDFHVEDVWALPTPGGPDDFPLAVAWALALDPARSTPVVRALFALRWAIGGVLNWDTPGAGVESRVPTLRRRLPPDLRRLPPGMEFAAVPFRPLYMLRDEFAAESANQTMHGILHLGWVEDGPGSYHAQMAVLVKRNGLLGAAYMGAIWPFRHLFVYPLMLREVGRAWHEERVQHAARA